MAVWIVIAIIYAIFLLPLLFLVFWAISGIEGTDEFGEVLTGTATNAIIAVLTSFVMTRGIGFDRSTLVWVCFVVLCGLSVWLPTPIKFKSLIIVSAVPALVLLVSALAIYGLPEFLGRVACGAISAEDAHCPESTKGVMSLTLMVALASVPGIMASVFARSRLLWATKFLMGTDPTKIDHLEKTINSIIRIGTILFGLFLAVQ